MEGIRGFFSWNPQTQQLDTVHEQQAQPENLIDKAVWAAICPLPVDTTVEQIVLLEEVTQPNLEQLNPMINDLALAVLDANGEIVEPENSLQNSVTQTSTLPAKSTSLATKGLVVSSIGIVTGGTYAAGIGGMGLQAATALKVMAIATANGLSLHASGLLAANAALGISGTALTIASGGAAIVVGGIAAVAIPPIYNRLVATNDEERAQLTAWESIKAIAGAFIPTPK